MGRSIAKLSTTISKIQFISNTVNGNLKIVIAYASFLGPSTSFFEICERRQIISFLDSRKRSLEQDPDGKWITTWNDYLHRVKHFDGYVPK
jgi:hypothetical protein